jgi:hypothetical protein
MISVVSALHNAARLDLFTANTAVFIPCFVFIRSLWISRLGKPFDYLLCNWQGRMFADGQLIAGYLEAISNEHFSSIIMDSV